MADNILEKVPVDIIRKYQIYPEKVENGHILIWSSASDPEKEYSINFEFLIGSPVKFIQKSKADIAKAIKDNFGLKISEITKDIKPEKSVSKHDSSQNLSSTQEQVLDHVLQKAIDLRSSDVHLEIYKNEVVLRYRVDGVLIQGEAIPFSLYENIINRIKVISNADSSEKRLPQDGQFDFEYNNQLFDIRTSFIPSIYGEVAVLRILDHDIRHLSLSELGFDPKALEILENTIKKPPRAYIS